MCAKLKQSMYSTRDAAQNWGPACTQFMCDTRFKKGVSSPCIFWNAEAEVRHVVHGDNSAVLGHKQELDWFWNPINKKFQSKRRGRIGPEESDTREIRIPKRIVTWTPDGMDPLRSKATTRGNLLDRSRSGGEQQADQHSHRPSRQGSQMQGWNS